MMSMKTLNMLVLTLIVSTAVFLFSMNLFIQDIFAYYREVKHVSGHLAVDKGDAYGPYPYGVNTYYTVYLDSVSPEPGLYIGYINANTHEGVAYYKYPGQYIHLPRDGADYYATYINTDPNTVAVDYTGRIITVIT